MDGDIGRAGIGAGVAWDEVGRLKEYIGFVGSDAGQRSDTLKEIVEGVAHCIVHGCLVVLSAGEKVVAIWI